MKNTKRSLLTSCVSLLLCFVMLLGTTFAWFTDVATSSGNVIKTGNLDIVLKKGALNENGEWTWTENQGEAIFDYDKWEPGYMTYAALAVENVGSLDARITAKIVLNGTPTILGEVIDVYTYVGGFDNYDPSVRPDFSDGNWQTLGTMADLIGGTGTVLPARNLSAGQRARMIVALHMREDAGNEYQDMDLGANFDIKILATQASSESDSFGNDYDVDAEWPNIPIVGNSASANVTLDENNQLTEEVTMTSADGKISATLPVGTKLLPGTTNVKLVISDKENSEANLTLEENEASLSLDVHITNIADDNTMPIKVELGEVLPVGLNLGNHSLYHVENGQTVGMTLLDDTVGTSHNTYAYDPATGEVIVYMASFSEIAVVANTENAWNGEFDYSWYNTTGTYFEIANADQLAAFGAIVGGMKKVTEVTKGEGNVYTYTYSNEEPIQDSFKNKTVKLISDINIADTNEYYTDASENGIVFYPIGYYNSEGTYEKTGTAITSGLRIFEGTFDGNGHTVKNFYHNTWEMKGDHDWYDATLQYYRDGMGLFGRVYKGTVKNLTVENFSSDGEIATTGVIAAYADGATFENIAIFNCNPRVYNIGNGGIVGCVGWYAKEADLKTTFTNITVDNSNKISALWGSYDVACGGIVGQYYPTSGQSSAEYPVNAGIHFDNCHVSAVMDVYNDVCANYQYYAYRYTGMLIGSVRENVEQNGHVYPKMDGITAKECTVHFGDWNDYYYCEIIDNTTASYTHDYQMSRLEEIRAIDGNTITYLDGTTGTVPASGRANYVIVDYSKGHGSENATCYHFKDGAVWTHDMGGIQTGIDENGDGKDDLKEDKQHLYLEFNNLVTGYGWGVTSKGVDDLDGVTILDREVGDSVNKFAPTIDNGTAFSTESTVTIGDIFAAINNPEVAINTESVQVAVSPFGATSTAGGTYVANTTDWTQGTLTFSGMGQAVIAITDYYFCKTTTVTVNVVGADKFDTNFVNYKDYLYRVGNANESTVALGTIFKHSGKGTINSANVSVTFETIGGNASGTFTANTSDWTKGTIQFTGTGVVKVSIKDDTSKEFVLHLEVVDAVNATGTISATSNNVVLLNDCGLNSITISGRYTFYGNGFTATYTGNGQYLRNGLKQGVVTVSENGTLDNLRIKASIYPSAFMYYGSTTLGEYVQQSSNPTDTEGIRYYYQLSAVAASGNATISNCYIYGGRTNIFVNTGDVTIKDTVLECGTVANMQIQSNASHAITLENVTTIQHQVNPTIGDTSKVMLGAGIVVGPETTENPKIVLRGDFKQYNWVTAEDANAVSSDTTKMIINGALDAEAYNHTVNGKTASNLGIIYMNKVAAEITNNTGLPYVLDTVTMTANIGINASVDGQVYSLQNATEEQIYSDYANADKSTENGLYQPQFKYDADLGGQYVAEGGDEHCFREGDTIHVMFPSGDSKEIDLTALVNITKYIGQDLGLVITVKDENGNEVAITDGKITISDAGEYTVTYTVTDTLFFDKDGNTITDSKEYSWDVTVSVSLKDTAVPDAYFDFDSTKQKMGYYKPTLGDVKQYLPFLAGLKIYDYNGQTPYLRFDGDTDFNKIASITITEYISNEAYIEVKLTDGGVINTKFLARADSGGGSTYTGSIKTKNNVVYFVNAGGTSNKDTTTTAAYWYVDYYKFTGNNGVAIQSSQQTFNSTGSSASTPSGSFNTTIQYTVSYDANGGNCGQTTGYATSASASVTLPTPTRSGYIFAGWYTAASGGTKIGDAGASYTPSADITLYAQWGKPCTVTYNANGGSCGTASEKYTGTALTLPAATRDGYWFIGWYDAAEGGNKIGEAGATYNPNGDTTLYAHWQEQVEYTVTYDANGGTCGTASATYEGTALPLPTPTRTGYKFLGWYTAASGGTKIGDAGATYVPSANITLYARWEALPTYTITIGTQTNATVTVDKNSTYEGDTVSVTVSFSQSNNRTLTVKDASGNTILSKSAAGTYTFTMPASNVTISASSEKSCVTSDTLVMLADGTQKRIDEVTTDDMLLVWNFYTGDYDVVPAAIIFYHGDEEYDVVKLYFEDGTTVKVINNHGFYDVELDKFVFLDETNADEYIGHKFVKVDGDERTSVALVGYEVVQEYTGCYSIQTAVHINFMVEGMFSLTIPPIDGWFDYFEIGDDMKYDEEKMQADIEKYGLYEYEVFAVYGVTYEQFIAFNGPYLKVLVGRGVLTFEQILELISTYVVTG